MERVDLKSVVTFSVAVQATVVVRVVLQSAIDLE